MKDQQHRGHEAFTWMQDLCTPEEWLTLRIQIAVHEQRLQHLAPPARTEAVVDALLDDARANPMLAMALRRIGRHGAARRHQRGPDN